MPTILNFISVVSALLFGVGILYWIMDVSIGKLKFLYSEREWHGLQYKDAVFLIVSLILILTTSTFYKPY